MPRLASYGAASILLMIVPAILLAYSKGPNANAYAAANDAVSATTYLVAGALPFIWGVIGNYGAAWSRMMNVVMISFSVEAVAMGLQRAHYGLFRAYAHVGHCGSHDARIYDVELCDISQTILQATWIPGILQWIGAIGIIGIVSPLLARPFGHNWLLVGVMATTAIWFLSFTAIRGL